MEGSVRRSILTVLLVGSAGVGCVGPLGVCDFETVEITMPVTIQRDGAGSPATLFNVLAPTNLSGNEYELLRDVLIRNQGPGAVFTVPAFDANPGMLALAFRTPLAVGQRLPVTRAFAGGGWGLVTPGVGSEEVWISVRDEGFQATAVEGWLEVTGVRPLAFALDVTASDDTGYAIRLAGTGAFRLREERRACD